MTRRIVVLLLVALALLALDRSLTHSRERERAARNRVARLLSDDERAELTEPPVLLVERPGEAAERYAPSEGYWRALDHELAPADARAIQGLIETFVEAEGILATREVDQAPAFGINTGTTLRVSLLNRKGGAGATPRTLVAFDVGASLPGKDAAFVRKRGTKEVWVIDGDPRARLTPLGPGLPPLVEPGVVPSAWKGWQSGLVSVRVERAGEPPGEASWELARIDLDPRAEGLEPGEPPWKWVLDPGAGNMDATRERAEAYAAYLEAVPYAAVRPRAEREALVPTPAAARVVLAARAGESFTLELGPAREDGTVPLWAGESSTLFLLLPETVPLLLPARNALTESEGENPWAPATGG